MASWRLASRDAEKVYNDSLTVDLIIMDKFDANRRRLLALGGAFVAARQSWLQWYPPEVVSCGRDFYGMIEQMPLSRALPQIFSGNGDCSQVDWRFLGGSIANWAFVSFVGLMIISIGWLFALRNKRDRNALQFISMR